MNLSQLFYAYSYNQGETWRGNIPVSPEFNSFQGFPNQNKLGDYYTIISDEVGADVAYAATFNQEQDVYYLRVFPDCNENGISDVVDIRDETSRDDNGNFIPDECEPGLLEIAVLAVEDTLNAVAHSLPDDVRTLVLKNIDLPFPLNAIKQLLRQQEPDGLQQHDDRYPQYHRTRKQSGKSLKPQSRGSDAHCPHARN